MNRNLAILLTNAGPMNPAQRRAMFARLRQGRGVTPNQRPASAVQPAPVMSPGATTLSPQGWLVTGPARLPGGGQAVPPPRIRFPDGSTHPPEPPARAASYRPPRAPSPGNTGTPIQQAKRPPIPPTMEDIFAKARRYAQIQTEPQPPRTIL